MASVLTVCSIRGDYCIGDRHWQELIVNLRNSDGYQVVFLALKNLTISRSLYEWTVTSTRMRSCGGVRGLVTNEKEEEFHPEEWRGGRKQPNKQMNLGLGTDERMKSSNLQSCGFTLTLPAIVVQYPPWQKYAVCRWKFSQVIIKLYFTLACSV